MSESLYTPSSVLINETPLLWNNASLTSAANLRRNIVLPPVQILLLPENHSDVECHYNNAIIVSNTLRSEFSTPKGSTPKLLLMNEGTDVHACFQASFPPNVINSIIIIENPPGDISDLHEFSIFINMVPLMKPGLTTPSGHPIDEEFHTTRFEQNGYANLMKKVKGRKLLKQLIGLGIKGEKEALKTKVLNEILRLLSESESVDPQVRNFSRQLLEGKSDMHIINLEIIAMRDVIFFEKLKARVAKEPEVRLVIWMPGAMHYNGIKKLIEDTPGFILHANSATSAQANRLIKNYTLRRRRSQRSGTRRRSRAKASRT
jgi:hypothetical protein